MKLWGLEKIIDDIEDIGIDQNTLSDYVLTVSINGCDIPYGLNAANLPRALYTFKAASQLLSAVDPRYKNRDVLKDAAREGRVSIKIAKNNGRTVKAIDKIELSRISRRPYMKRDYNKQEIQKRFGATNYKVDEWINGGSLSVNGEGLISGATAIRLYDRLNPVRRPLSRRERRPYYAGVQNNVSKKGWISAYDARKELGVVGLKFPSDHDFTVYARRCGAKVILNHQPRIFAQDLTKLIGQAEAEKRSAEGRYNGQ